jgi:hypothetical protein
VSEFIVCDENPWQLMVLEGTLEVRTSVLFISIPVCPLPKWVYILE